MLNLGLDGGTMKRLAMTIVALLLAATSLKAQYGYTFSGEVMSQAGMSTSQFAQLSQHHILGTARSMAMAGAFTSLGGDISAMNINPAGLGMYSTSEFTLTPSISISKSGSNHSSYGSNTSTQFTPSNLGVVFNLYRGLGKVRNIVLGFGYNRVADLNYDSSLWYDNPYSGGEPSPSILNLMAGQLTVNKLYPDQNGFLGYYGERYPDLWGSMLAYNSYLINPYEDNEGEYWAADHVGQNASIGHFFQQESRGYIGEYDISFGMDLSSKFYIGATLGIQNISQSIYTYYGEDYLYGDDLAVDAGGGQLVEQADYMHYGQGVDISGVGVNFKIGIIYRPTKSVRIGVAYHTPTSYSLDHSYTATLRSLSYNNANGEYYDSSVNTEGDWVDSSSDSWKFRTPSRLLLGGSYAFKERAVISVDYERAWYGGIKVRNTPRWIPNPEDYTRQKIRSQLRATNSLRIGAEFKPTQRWALRAGFSYTDAVAEQDKYALNGAVSEQTIYYTGGAGFRITPRIGLDLAYRYMKSEMSDYRLFYSSQDSGSSEVKLYDASQKISSTICRHNLALTLSVKF